MCNLLSNLFKLGKGAQTRGNVDIELGLQGSAHPGLHDFLEEVREIEELLDTLTKLLKDLQNSKGESKAATKASDVKEIKMRMEKVVDEVTKVARLGKSKLQRLNEDNLANRGKPGFGEGTYVDRCRTQTTNGLTMKLRHGILEFQTLREEIRKEYREVVERRVFIVTGEYADEETIDRLIVTGESEKLYQRAIQEQGHGRVRTLLHHSQVHDTLQEIQERHDTMKEIETNLLELHQRRKVLKDIEAQVKGASAEDVKAGTDQLQEAKILQRKNTRNWICIPIIILLIIVLVVVLSLKPWAK